MLVGLTQRISAISLLSRQSERSNYPRGPPDDPNQAVVEPGSSGAISGNIGSYAADSMVSRCGPPTPPPARAADSDTLDPGTVRPSVPVYDKPVFLPRSCGHALLPG